MGSRHLQGRAGSAGAAVACAGVPVHFTQMLNSSAPVWLSRHVHLHMHTRSHCAPSPLALQAIMQGYYDRRAWAQGVSTGWPHLDESYRVVPGELTVVTGAPEYSNLIGIIS